MKKLTRADSDNDLFGMVVNQGNILQAVIERQNRLEHTQNRLEHTQNRQAKEIQTIKQKLNLI